MQPQTLERGKLYRVEALMSVDEAVAASLYPNWGYNVSWCNRTKDCIVLVTNETFTDAPECVKTLPGGYLATVEVEFVEVTGVDEFWAENERYSFDGIRLVPYKEKSNGPQ